MCKVSAGAAADSGEASLRPSGCKRAGDVILVAFAIIRKGILAVRFAFLGSIFGCVLLLAAGFVWLVLPRAPGLWRRIPRERVVGGALGLVCLIWSAKLVSPLFEGGLSRVRSLLPALVILLTVAAVLLLDYLLTRALGGFILLVVSFLLHEAFTAHVPYRALFAVVCYALGVVGLFMIGSPYRFRDFLEKSAQPGRYRCVAAASLALGGAVSLLISIAGHAN